MQLTDVARKNINLLLERCDIKYEVTPFDHDLYQDCIDDARQRGYRVDGPESVVTFLRGGVVYAATAGVHLPDRPTRIWIALYTSCLMFAEETPNQFPSELENTYRFSDRCIRKEPQGNGALDAFADIIRRASELYPRVASHLIATSSLNFVTASLLEHETQFMKISSAAQEYATFQRRLSGGSVAYSFMVFPREVPLNDYIQAIPEITSFTNNVNDIMSFYKEELAGETTNQISILAAGAQKSKSDVLAELTEATVGLYRSIVKILEASPSACEAFKQFAGGYVRFHTSLSRYQIDDLGL